MILVLIRFAEVFEAAAFDTQATKHRSEGARGARSPGTAYVIPACVGVWLLGGCFPGSDVRLRFVVVVVARLAGRCFSGYVSGDGDHTDVFS